MGRDKALLPHPQGGTWLERALDLLLALDQPVCLVSHHEDHRSLAASLMAQRQGAGKIDPPLTVFPEPPPREGPLLALGRLMAQHPGERLLLCPVDMPWLTADCLKILIAAASNAPLLAGNLPPSKRIYLAHDGTRLQPLLALIPATAARRQGLGEALAAGERSFQRWLATEDWQPVTLPALALRNCNRPHDLPPGVGFP